MVNDTNVVQIAPILRALAHDVAVVGVASEKKMRLRGSALSVNGERKCECVNAVCHG